MSAATNLGQLSYASFYLPPLTFGYLSFEDNNPFITYIAQINFEILIFSLKPIHAFWFLTAFTFLGAMQAHGVARAIYGPDGPEKRPKHKTIHIRHSLSFVLGTDAENIPVIPCRLAHRGLIRELLRDINQDRNQLKASFKQFKEIGLMLTLSKIPRVLYFTPMGLHRLSGRVAFIALGAVLYFGRGSYVAFVLFAALFVLLFRKIIWAPLPTVLNTDGLDDRFTAEYQSNDVNDEG
ncbi:hypothetical protein [Natronorubrum halophilum]|uniref:hypothetical protein n=1 Tax=Natronorubrum halophilum TaxID=1702106 RepID=UPI0013CED601|nr:hypothetical protein [Natronorubrum halophilum]